MSLHYELEEIRERCDALEAKVERIATYLRLQSQLDLSKPQPNYFDILVNRHDLVRIDEHGFPVHRDYDDPYPGHEGDAAGDDGWHPDDPEEES